MTTTTNPATRTAIAALLTADASVPQSLREAVLDLLDGKRTVADGGTPFPRVMSADEAAKATGLCTRSLRSYARKGYLRPAYYGGGRRAWGYSAESVREFIDQACAPKSF